MLACIACSKHDLEDGGEDTARAATTPSGKEAVKSLTSQIKDMVLKFSGSHRQCKGGSSSFRSKSLRHQPHGSYNIDDAGSDIGGRYGQLHAASSNSTPAWDFMSVNEEARCRAKWAPGPGGGMAASEDVVLEDDNEPKEWMAQVEPGVHITFVSLPGGAGNDLKRIRFRFDAIRWLDHLLRFVTGVSETAVVVSWTAGRCSTSGKRRGGGERTTTGSWSCTTCSGSTARHFLLLPDPTMEARGNRSARGSGRPGRAPSRLPSPKNGSPLGTTTDLRRRRLLLLLLLLPPEKGSTLPRCRIPPSTSSRTTFALLLPPPAAAPHRLQGLPASRGRHLRSRRRGRPPRPETRPPSPSATPAISR